MRRAFAGLDAIVTCQGGDWTTAMYPKLRDSGWNGYWIDAAKTLRMKDDAVIILDPVNRPVIDAAIAGGIRNYIGGNCTVSLMMMALAGLLGARPDRVDDVHDLPGGVGCWRAEHARTAASDGRRASGGQEPAGRSEFRHPGHRPRSRRHPARRKLPYAALRGAAGGLTHTLDRQGHGQRDEPGGVEGRGRDQQDPGSERARCDSRGLAVRAHRRDALPQPGADDQAATRCAAGRDRDRCWTAPTNG